MSVCWIKVKKELKYKVLSFLLFFLVYGDSLNCKTFYYIETAGHFLWLSSLYFLWYRNQPLDHFKFYNDLREWQGMDKAGHVYSVFVISQMHYSLHNFYCNTNNEELKKYMLSAGLGMVTLTIMEFLDGFGKGWGFSIPDMFFNTAGAILWLSSRKFYPQISISPAFSYHDNPIWKERPERLGKSLIERIFKNYNGQTYWLKFGYSYFPVSLAIGYSARGMTGASPSSISIIEKERYPVLLLSFDVIWKNLPFKNFYLKKIANVMNYIKVPFPALLIAFKKNSTIIKFQGIYF